MQLLFPHHCPDSFCDESRRRQDLTDCAKVDRSHRRYEIVHGVAAVS